MGTFELSHIKKVSKLSCFQASQVAQWSRIRLSMQETQEMQVRSLGQEDPLEEEMATHSSILAWRIPMDRGVWWATVHGVAKSQTRQATEQHTSCFQIRKEAREQVVPQGKDMPAPYMYLLPTAQNNFPEINNPKEWTRKTLASLFPWTKTFMKFEIKLQWMKKNKIKRLCYIESPKDLGMQNLRKRRLQWGIRALPAASLLCLGGCKRKEGRMELISTSLRGGTTGWRWWEGRGSKSES